MDNKENLLKDYSIDTNEDNVSLIRRSLTGRDNEKEIKEIKKELIKVLQSNICALNYEANIDLIKKFIDISNMGVGLVDLNGNIEYCNECFYDLMRNYIDYNSNIELDKQRELEREFNFYKLGDSENENSLNYVLITESENKKLLDILTNLQDIVANINSRSSIEGIISIIYYKLSEFVSLDRLSFAGIYFEEGVMKAEALVSFNNGGQTPIPHKMGKEISPDSNLYKLIYNKEFRIINDLEAWQQEYNIESDFTKNLINQGFKSSMTFPIFGNDETPLGIMFSNSYKKNAYDEKELNILRYIVSFINSNIENINNYNSISMESIKDKLTNLYNRRSFEKVLYTNIPLELSESYNGNRIKEYNLVSLDIDYFKSLNDKFGHQLGDEVLKRIGALLNSVIGENGRIFRVGGEEFAIIFDSYDISNLKEFLTHLQHQINSMEFSVNDGNETINISASFGVVTFNNNAINDTNTSKDIIEKNMQSIYELADKMLYISKDKGRNQISIFNTKICTLSPRGLRLPDVGIYNYVDEILKEDSLEDFSDIIKGQKLSSNEILRENFLKNIDLFKNTDNNVLYELSKNFYVEYYNQGDSLIEKGKNPSKIYILKEGLLNIKMGDEQVEIGDKYIRPGDIIGEMSFLEGTEHNYTVNAYTDSCVWSIDIEDFERIISQNEKLLNTLEDLKNYRYNQNWYNKNGWELV